MVDEAYEKEVFEDITHIDSGQETEEAVDDIFRDSPGLPVEPLTEETIELAERPDAKRVDARVEDAEQESLPEKKPKISESEEDESQAEAPVKAAAAEESKTEPGKKVQKKAKGPEIDEGNYAVTLDDYDRLMHPPKREPRTDCLFEVTCTLGDQSTTGIGLDISSGGIFIDSKEHFGVGKVLDLTFKLREEDQEPIRCRGAVTWVNERPDPIKPNYPNGFGVHFLDVDAATAQMIDDFLNPDDVERSDGTEDDL